MRAVVASKKITCCSYHQCFPTVICVSHVKKRTIWTLSCDTQPFVMSQKPSWDHRVFVHFQSMKTDLHTHKHTHKHTHEHTQTLNFEIQTALYCLSNHFFQILKVFAFCSSSKMAVSSLSSIISSIYFSKPSQYLHVPLLHSAQLK